MRTPTIVCLSALASALIVAPTALVAHEYLEHEGIGFHGSVLDPTHHSKGDGSGSSDDGSTDTRSSGSGTSTRATASQAQGVVMIDTAMAMGEGAGTGMVLSEDGTVLTNYHVVNGSSLIRVTVANGQTYDADVVGHDQSHDIAVLKLRNAAGLTPVSLDSDGAAVAESVLAVGQGNGEGVLFAARGKVLSTDARITAKDKSALAASEKLTGLIRTNAPIVPGYSGGPLFDAHGKVVGIDTAASVSDSSAGYSSSGAQADTEGFAIPITQAKPIADDILAGRKTATNHLGPRASLGIRIMPTKDGARPDGVPVLGVVAGGAADSAGLDRGDVITEVDGHRISNTTDLSHAMDRERPGSKVALTWTDSEGTHSADVKLNQSPEN